MKWRIKLCYGVVNWLRVPLLRIESTKRPSTATSVVAALRFDCQPLSTLPALSATGSAVLVKIKITDRLNKTIGKRLY
jgi:hypothetical protein